MAWGISPKKIEIVPLGDYNSDHYLTLMYHAMVSLGWHVGYFDHDGVIAYTDISWPSYSEEISARIKDNNVIVKSECVGFQGFFTDYGKNKKNLQLLFDEIIYVEQVYFKDNLEETTQELIDSIPEKQFLSLDDPPMAGKEQLRGFFSPFIPRGKYAVTPVLVILNTLVFLATSIGFFVLAERLSNPGPHALPDEAIQQKLYLLFGYNHRDEVLNGQVWRLVTSIFLHFSLLHLVCNMIVLVYIGSLLECKLGKWNYLLMFLFTGIISGMSSVAFHDVQISAGASGAIFGLFGIMLALLSTDFYERSARKALLISTAIFVSLNIIPVGEGIDHAAHFGGIISGYVFGWIAYLGLSHKSLFIKKWGITLIGSVIVMISVTCCVLFLPRYQFSEFQALGQKMDAITADLDHYFYQKGANGYYMSLSGIDRLDSIQQKALPELEELKKLAPRFNKLYLPVKQQKAAKMDARVIDLAYQAENYLYLEIKEQNTEKYRWKVDSLTMIINDVRNNFLTGK